MSDTRPQAPFEPPEMPDPEGTRVQGDLSKTKGMPPTQPSPAQPPTAPKTASPAATGARQPTHTPPSGTRPPEKANVPPPPTARTGLPSKPKRGQPPPPPQAGAMFPPAQETGRTPSQPTSFYLPIWSVAMTLLMVCGAVSCIVFGVVSLGGRTAPAAAPQFVVITAVVPTNTAFVPELIVPNTLPDQSLQTATLPAFTLSGPTLAPIIISPTPETISVGKTVLVDADESGLNVRSGAGIQNERLFVAADGETLVVIDGPLQADGLTWWKVQNPDNPSRSGWAAAVYLELPTPSPG